jgi:hypothetical protein
VIDKSSKIPEDTAALLVNNTKLTDGFILNDIRNVNILESNDRNILNVIDSDIMTDVIDRVDCHILNNRIDSNTLPIVVIEAEE